MWFIAEMIGTSPFIDARSNRSTGPWAATPP